MRRILFFGTVALLGLAVIGCVNREQQKQAKKTEEILADTTKPVVLVSVGTADLKDVLSITGAITTSEDVQVSAKNPGRLVSVYVKDGDPVVAGQVIAVQESIDAASRLRQASGQVQSAQAAVSQALANFKQGPIKSYAAVKAAEAQLSSAKALLAKARKGPRDEERNQAVSAVNAAKSNMDTAKADLDRKRQLFEEGAISRQALDQAENAYQNALSAFQTAMENERMLQNWTRPEDLQVAEESVRAAQQALNQAKANQKLDGIYKDQLDAARSNLKSAIAAQDLARQAVNDTQIRAPFGGTISGKPVQAGTFVASGTPVARIVGKGGIYFEGQIPESSVDKVNVGRKVSIKLSALPGRTFEGRIIAISPSGDNIGRQFNARIQLTGDTTGAKVGMFAVGVIDLQNLMSKTVVPADSIVKSGQQTYVFVVEGNKAKKVEVKTGIQNDGVLEVSGVQVGQKVVVKGQAQLVDGSIVKVDDGKPADEKQTDGRAGA